MIDELEALANRHGASIYNICHRNAGWAIQWYEESRQADSKNWKDGLVIYRYYDTFAEALAAETKRLEEIPVTF